MTQKASKSLTFATQLHLASRLEDAIAVYREILAADPENAVVLHHLGLALFQRGQREMAIEHLSQAVKISPDYAEGYYDLGLAYHQLGEYNQSIASYFRAIELRPDFAEALSNLGNALFAQGRLDDAVAAYQRALLLRPDSSVTYNDLGVVLKEQGQLNKSVDCHRRAIRIDPANAVAHSNLVFTIQYSPEFNAAAIAAEAAAWNEAHAACLAPILPARQNGRSPNRRLKIGYISPNFRDHCQANFLVPLLSSHDHERFEIVCYDDVSEPDSMTMRLLSYADAWRRIAGMTNDQAASVIAEDGIDILVDLTMHMEHNRLLVFARKPAPVQVAWLAYPGTTGVTMIDYRLTDPYLDPPGAFEQYYSEASLRLPDTFWCYNPLSALAVNSLPAATNGYITFGCLNNFCKVNDQVLTLWSDVLRALPDSKLVLLVPEGSCRERCCHTLRRLDVASERLIFVGRQERDSYLRIYHQIDVALDTLPYNGHTTSLDSFWMGVPVITLVGQTVVGRAGYSQLMNLGLSELIAWSPEDLIRIAVDLARDVNRLATLRRCLRQRMERSPLMDAYRFTAGLENSFKLMWHAKTAA